MHIFISLTEATTKYLSFGANLTSNTSYLVNFPIANNGDALFFGSNLIVIANYLS